MVLGVHQAWRRAVRWNPQRRRVGAGEAVHPAGGLASTSYVVEVASGRGWGSGGTLRGREGGACGRREGEGNRKAGRLGEGESDVADVREESVERDVDVLSSRRLST